MDISVILKAFDDFKEELMKSKDMEIKQLREELQEDSEAWGDWVAKEKEKTAKMEETHLRFIEEWRKEKEDWRKEKEDWLDQVVNLQEEVEGLKERNEELVEENEILKEDNLEYMTKELIN
jgi:chromosome segregation ATPase